MSCLRLSRLSLICVALASLSGCIDKRSGSTAGEAPAPAETKTASATKNEAVEPMPAEVKTEPAKSVSPNASPADVTQLAAVSSAESSRPSTSPAKSAEPAPSADPAKKEAPAKNDASPKSTAEGVSETRIRTPARGKKNDNSGISELTFDDIKFEMKEKEEPFRREMLTPAIEALNGKKVRLRGYILPSFQRELTQFVLMRDNMECCFGPGAWIYDCVIVDMKPGKSAEYTTRPVAVEGTFEVNEFLDADGKHLSVYRILGEQAK